MSRFTVRDLDEEQRTVMLEWLVGEGLNPAAISDNGRFSVHNGRVSGDLFLINTDTNTLSYHRGWPVLVPFNVAQVNPLPKELQ